MQLHQLKTKNNPKKTKRIARGGKRGTYSGRGQKGQKSRAGHRIRPAVRDLIQRIPKIRGFKFKSKRVKSMVINLNQLEAKLKDNIINMNSLKVAGLLRQVDRAVKILGVGDIKRPFVVEKGVALSETAKKKILAAGGKIG